MATGARMASTTTVPACRATSSRAASPTVRSGSSSPANAGTARPIPAPARICGGTVHHRLVPGRNASAAAPPATNSVPAAARGSGRPLTAVAAIAATGSTVTATAAFSGPTAKPATSSRTSMKSKAVKAAAHSPSAMVGATRPRGISAETGSAGSDDGAARRHAIAAAAAIGACTAKIARQSNASVSTPPIAGPAAVPATAAPSHTRRPCRDTPASSTSNAVSRATAPPAACSARATSRTVSEGAAAQITEATAKSPSPAAPAPRRRITRSAGTIASAMTSA